MGGGASALALVDFFNSAHYTVSQLDIVDRSEDQIEISKNMVGCSGINIQYYTQSAIDYLSASKMKYDLIFASNILCETDRGRELSILVQLLSNALSDIGKLLVVERTESKIYEVLEENKNLNIVKYMYQNKRYMIPIENNYFDFVDKTTSSNLSEFIKKEYTLRYALYEQYNSPKI